LNTVSDGDLGAAAVVVVLALVDVLLAAANVRASARPEGAVTSGLASG
jgi:hypothetical protein